MCICAYFLIHLRFVFFYFDSNFPKPPRYSVSPLRGAKRFHSLLHRCQTMPFSLSVFTVFVCVCVWGWLSVQTRNTGKRKYLLRPDWQLPAPNGAGSHWFAALAVYVFSPKKVYAWLTCLTDYCIFLLLLLLLPLLLPLRHDSFNKFICSIIMERLPVDDNICSKYSFTNNIIYIILPKAVPVPSNVPYTINRIHRCWVWILSWLVCGCVCVFFCFLFCVFCVICFATQFDRQFMFFF